MNWLILAGFLLIAYSDWKRRIIPDVLLAIIAVLALITRTRIDFYEHLAVGAAACLVGFALYKVGQWSAGDVKLAGVVGLVFGSLTPYVALWTALAMIAYRLLRKPSQGLPLGVPVFAGVLLSSFLHLGT